MFFSPTGKVRSGVGAGQPPPLPRSDKKQNAVIVSESFKICFSWDNYIIRIFVWLFTWVKFLVTQKKFTFKLIGKILNLAVWNEKKLHVGNDLGSAQLSCSKLLS